MAEPSTRDDHYHGSNSVDTLTSTLNNADGMNEATLRSSQASYQLPFSQRLAFSVGHVLNDLCSAVWFTYLLVYMQQVREFSASLAGITLLVGQIADGIATPFVGIESDRDTDWWLCRYGKRKTWHLLGTVCVIVSFPLIFNQCIGCENSHQWAQVIYYCAFIVIFQFGWASTQISHLSLIPELTPHSNERCELNAWRYAFTVVSNITVYVITWLFLGLGSTQGKTTPQVCPHDGKHFRNIVLCIVAIGTAFSFIFHFVVKEGSKGVAESQKEAFTSHDGIDYSKRENHLRWYDWFKVTQFYKVGLLYMSTRLVINLTQAYTPFYIQYTLMLSRAAIAYIPLLMYVSGFFSSFIMKPINSRIGKKWTFCIGAIISLSGLIWVYVGRGNFYNHYAIYAVCFLLGISGSTMLITSLAITNDLIGHNTSSGAFVFGAMSFLDKLSNGGAVMVVQSLNEHSGTASTDVSFYRNVLAFVCGGATILALIALLALSGDEIGAKRKNIPTPRKESVPADTDREREPLLCQHSINGGNHNSIVPVHS